MSYQKQSFQNGNVLEASQLNAIEDQVALNEAAATLALEKASAVEAATAGKYAMPSGGIPESDLSADVRALLNDGASPALKAALLQFAQKASYIDDSGPSVYTALYNALNSVVTLVSISAALNQGVILYEYNTLDDVASELTVTATYSDSSMGTITGFTVSGTLAIGSSTITVSYGGVSTTVAVNVRSALPSDYTRLTYVEADGNQWIETDVRETEVGHADYEIAVTQTTERGGHIFSTEHVYYPFFKGVERNTMAARWYGSEETSYGSTAFSWELNRFYKISAYDDVYVDGVKIFSITPGDLSNAARKLHFFTYGYGRSETRWRFYGKLKYFILYNRQGVLSRYYIPCKNSSNIVGLYDALHAQFLHSDTGIELIAGEEVV